MSLTAARGHSVVSKVLELDSPNALSLRGSSSSCTTLFTISVGPSNANCSEKLSWQYNALLLLEIVCPTMGIPRARYCPILKDRQSCSPLTYIATLAWDSLVK